MMLLQQHTWLLLPLATVLSAGLAIVLIPLAGRIGWVDHPGEHKVHESKTPTIGGMAVFAALVITFIIASASGTVPGLTAAPIFAVLLAGAAAMLLTGLFDDLYRLRPGLRFLLQLLVCYAIMQFSGVRLDDFGQLFSSDVLALGGLAVPITIFAAMGVINAFNLIDGLDGLAGTIFIVASAGMALLAAWAGEVAMVWFLLLAMAAVLGFLLLNARLPWNGKARIFLGNSGSLALGVILAWCFISLGSGADRAFVPMTAVWFFAVPLLDTTSLIWLRWRAGRSAFAADQNHLHHAFLRAGYSVESSWAMIILMAVIFATIGIGFELSQLPEWVSFYSFMVVAFAYYFYMKNSWLSQRFLGRHFIHHDFSID